MDGRSDASSADVLLNGYGKVAVLLDIMICKAKFPLKQQ